jgi:hypothetical protein
MSSKTVAAKRTKKTSSISANGPSDPPDDKNNGNNSANDEVAEKFEPIPLLDLASYSLDHLIGVDQAVKLLRETVIYPHRYPNSMKIYTDSRGFAPNILLYGPPGTGKTVIAKSVAHELGLPLYEVPASKIQSSFQGRSARNFDALIDTVSKEQGGCVVFMDEGENLLAEGNGQMDTSIVNAFKSRVQVSGSKRSPAKVIFIIATNDPGRIKDSGVLSRFELKLYIGIPDSTKDLVRTRLFLKFVSTINTARCEEPSITIGLTPDEQEDLENLLFFYNNRELYFVAQTVWNYIECTPLRAREFMYLRNVGEYVKDRKSLGKGNSPIFVCISPNTSGVFPKFVRYSALQVLDNIENTGSSIEWGFANIESIKKALANPIIFSSITINVLKAFYYYAKNELRDDAGATKILKIMLKGYQAPGNTLAMKFKTSTFNHKEYTRQIPDWHIDKQILKSAKDFIIPIKTTRFTSASDEDDVKADIVYPTIIIGKTNGNESDAF